MQNNGMMGLERERLKNVVQFFSGGQTDQQKLFRLLFIMDFEHFRQTGKSITGVNYRSTPKGPVPCVDLSGLFDGAENGLHAMRDELFSHRMLATIKYVATRYRGPNSPTLKETLTACNGAFAVTPIGEVIAYEKAIPEDLPDGADLLVIAAEHAQRRAALIADFKGNFS